MVFAGLGCFFGFHYKEMSPPSPGEADWLYVFPQADKSGLLAQILVVVPKLQGCCEAVGLFLLPLK